MIKNKGSVKGPRITKDFFILKSQTLVRCGCLPGIGSAGVSPPGLSE